MREKRRGERGDEGGIYVQPKREKYVRSKERGSKERGKEEDMRENTGGDREKGKK